ncbi:MAG: hypothetical protein ABSB40_10240 [Nitrososphaeria archaeon]
MKVVVTQFYWNVSYELPVGVPIEFDVTSMLFSGPLIYGLAAVLSHKEG